MHVRRGGAGGGGDGARTPFLPGHLALLPLVAAAGPCELACASPPDAIARVELI
jgi:hypothetical protein